MTRWAIFDSKWFSELFGFEEGGPDEVRERFRLDGTVLHSKANGRSFQCGHLEIPTLQQLRDAHPPEVQDQDRLKVSVIGGNVVDLHADPRNAGALFQVASQFNLLEMVAPDVTPEQGITRYAYDRTQGPICAMACAAGLVYRNYFVPVNGRLGQTADNQIDCLDLIGEALDREEQGLWRMRNGYVESDAAALKHIAEVLGGMGTHDRERLKGLLKVGIQWNTEVTLTGAGHLVSQVYCSALPVAYYPELLPPLWKPFAQLVLEATYEATFHAAVLNHTKHGNGRLYLTQVGGGAFGNRAAWIHDAIIAALERFRHYPLDVRIVCYNHVDVALQAAVDRWQAERGL